MVLTIYLYIIVVPPALCKFSIYIHVNKFSTALHIPSHQSKNHPFADNIFATNNPLSTTITIIIIKAASRSVKILIKNLKAIISTYVLARCINISGITWKNNFMNFYIALENHRIDDQK